MGGGRAGIAGLRQEDSCARREQLAGGIPNGICSQKTPTAVRARASIGQACTDVSEQTQNGEDSSREGYGRDPMLEEGAKTMLMRLDQSPVRKTSEMRLKRRRQILAWLALATMLVVCPASGAVQDEYILRCSPHGHHWSGQPPRHGAHPAARRPYLWDQIGRAHV